MLRPTLVTAPSALPVELGLLKLHLRIDHSDEDALLTAILDTAVASLDGRAGDLNLAIMPQTWKVEFGNWPEELRLPLTPVSSITHVKYYDTLGVQQTLSAANYSAHTDEMGAYIRYGSTVVLPNLYYQRDDAIEVQFVAGYASASLVPPPIKSAILLLAADLYEHRESFVTGTIITQVPQFIMRLISRYTRVGA